MIRILIADDHPLVREGLKKTLKEEPDFRVCCEAKDSAGVLSLLKVHVHDVVVMDIAMPGKSGLEALAELKHDYPKLPVLILSMHPEERFAVRAIKSGAAGYMTKEAVPQELVRAIRKVVQGGRYITPSVAEKLAIEVGTSAAQAPHETLSNREFQLFCLIASGKTIKKIAKEMYLSINTVHTYRRRILEKMGMKTNAEMTQYALRNKLVD